QVSPDLKDMNVGVMAFDKSGTALERVVQFTAPADAQSLIETGESFLLRGAFDAEPEQAQAQAVQVAARVKEQKQDFPLQADTAPVELELLYNGQKVPLEIRGGQAQIPEPQEGQKVTFVLRRKADDKETYGVVLKVNGENTLYRQRKPDVA